MRMNKKKIIVPKLRFPEFGTSEGWKKYKLRELADRITKKVGDNKLVTLSISAGIGFVSQAEKFSRDISGKQYCNYIYLKKGEFSYNKGNSKTFPQGCIYELKEYDEAAVPNAFISFRFKENLVPSFYQGYFDSNFHGKQLVRFITSGARSDGLLNISPTDFFSIVLPTPVKKEEQQKIADCLSSIDDLIDAESRKMRALEKYKKGLMQKLFPAEGKILPEWRFPEFRGKREWRIKPLGKICANYDSRRIPITEKDRVRGKIPYIGASGVIDYINDFIFDEDLLCVSEDGANLVARTYPIAFSISGKTWVNNHAHVLKFSHKYTQNIVESYLNMTNLQDFLTGMAQPKLNRAKLDIIPIPLPEEEEQQKIANCLSEIDTMITQESNKVKQLKAHKKGLMQGLFPSLEEADV